MTSGILIFPTIEMDSLSKNFKMILWLSLPYCLYSGTGKRILHIKAGKIAIELFELQYNSVLHSTRNFNYLLWFPTSILFLSLYRWVQNFACVAHNTSEYPTWQYRTNQIVISEFSCERMMCKFMVPKWSQMLLLRR